MTLEQLRALEAVVMQGSVRAAGSKLHKTPQAISALIKNLEDEIGFPLLSRQGYRVKLTAEGTIFFNKAQLILKETNELEALCCRMRETAELVVNIALNAMCPMCALLPTLSNIEQRHPGTEINVSSEHLGGALERLKHAEADLAITTLVNIEQQFMETQHLLGVSLLPVAHISHPLANFDRLITQAEARLHRQVIVRDSSRKEEKQSLDIIEGARRCYVTDFHAKIEVIESGMGWGGVPEYMISDAVKRGDLKVLQVEKFGPRLSHIYLVRRSNEVAGPVAQAIWMRIKEDLSEQLKIAPTQGIIT